MSNPFSGLGNTHLIKDFGVSATIGSLVVIGSFATIIIGLLKGIDISALLPLIGSLLGGVVNSVFGIKAAKQARQNGEEK